MEEQKDKKDKKVRKDKRLSSKINSRFIALTLIAILCTMILSTTVYYDLFKKEIMRDLENYTQTLKSAGLFDDISELRNVRIKNTELRITLVAPDGTVKYDNMADLESMGKHNDRPEIEEAFEKGEGEDTRLSQTLNMSTFYYAIRLSNGCVLRVSKETSSIVSVFLKGLPSMTVIMLVLVTAVVLISRYLTKSIVRPIGQMAKDLDHIDDINAYKEIRPLIDTIREQHSDIMENAQMRQEFTANVSHELKTPLTAISGYSELIENGMATDGDVRRFATEIHRNSNRLLTLINDIIRLSELDVTENAPSMERIDLCAVARSNVDMLMLSAEKHNVTLKFSGQPSYIMGNKMMMEELVYNLTDNAIRYNKPDGTVEVTVYSYEIDHSVVMKVKDTGIGIPEGHLGLVFQRFYRVDKSRSKSTGGTGLGLAIVKHIVAQHDAKLDITSEPNVGTEITITFQSR